MNLPGAIRGLETDGSYLYASGDAGLTIYQLGGVGPISVTADVQVPNGTGVAVVPNSFNIAPTTIIPGTDYDTLEWNLTLNQDVPNQTLTFQTEVTALQPGETRAATLQSTVAFTSEGVNGQVALPAQNVFAAQVLGLTPATQTVAPGAPATYTLTIANPTTTDVTYDLSVQGVPAAWVQIPAQELVPAGGSVTVPLTLTADPFAPASSYDFVVSATVDGVIGSVDGTLVLAAPVLPPTDPDSHGVVVSSTPTQAAARPGNIDQLRRPASRPTRTGTDDTFSLSAAGLPAGVAASFSRPPSTCRPARATSAT